MFSKNKSRILKIWKKYNNTYSFYKDFNAYSPFVNMEKYVEQVKHTRNGLTKALIGMTGEDKSIKRTKNKLIFKPVVFDCFPLFLWPLLSFLLWLISWNCDFSFGVNWEFSKRKLMKLIGFFFGKFVVRYIINNHKWWISVKDVIEKFKEEAQTFS